MQKTLKRIQGVVKRHPDGFGFLLPDDKDHEDVFISRHDMEGIMSNDKLLIAVYADNRKDRFYGEVIRVISRANSEVHGILHKLNNDFHYLEDKENHWGANLKIPSRLSGGAKEGQLVNAKILAYPGDPRGFLGEVIEVIGNANDPKNDIRRAMMSFNIPTGFSSDTEKEIRQFSTEVEFKAETSKRKDLRNLRMITIDGVSAKDFDDAIYVETTNSGFRLWVSIADVSHYVKPGSALDRDALNKGNSSYFPMFVEPMLPEVLSNELCSLKPKVDRFAMTAEIMFDFRGEMLSSQFYESVIHSHSRVTYGEAQDCIDGDCPEKHKHVEDVILRAADLAKVLLHKRMNQGSLEIDVKETEVVVDEGGMPIDIIRRDRVFAHRLIEECMLAANVAVAKFLSDREKASVYRVHESPDSEKLETLERFLTSFGYEPSILGKNLQKKITKALQKFENTMRSNILSMMVLRSLKQAKYDTQNIGHFGLGFSHYTHFTSPIRRYPDLLVHRILKSHLNETDHKYLEIGQEQLLGMCQHCSNTEQRSVRAERLLTSIQRARFMQQYLGEQFEAYVTSVTKFGIFVGLRQFDVDGLVKVEDLGEDFWQYDEERIELCGKYSGFRYQLGTELEVQVANINVEQGQIDFTLVEVKEGNEKPNSDRQHHQERKKTSRNRKRSGKARLSKSRRKGKAR